MMAAGFYTVLGLQVTQIYHIMPTQAAVQARAGRIRAQELAHHRQQIIER